MLGIRRREFIAALGGAAAWPLAARAQQPGLPVVGVLGGGTRDASETALSAFIQGLNGTGYVDGRNMAIEYRWANGQYDRLGAMTADLVQRRAAVIATFSGTPTARAAKAATATIPIVFVLGSDPVAAGLVRSLSRPGGNLTGVTNLTIELAQKRLEVLHDLVPKVSTIGVLVNPANSVDESLIKETEAAAHTLGLRVYVLRAQVDSDFQPAFEDLIQQPTAGLVVAGDPFHLTRRYQIVALAARYRIPTIYYSREYVKVGGLMSYGPNVATAYGLAGAYAGRILKGEKPGDLPVQQPARFEIVINLQTAKALGIEVPPQLIARADEVIE
jgi:putative ABC transport system substrate-binding protein